MSGVYINMEMPTCCDDCFLYFEDVDESVLCAAGNKVIGENINILNERPGWCPLVPVPPHGDLIDRDKLEKDIDKYIGGEESRSRFHHWVQVQNTVIPMDKESET